MGFQDVIITLNYSMLLLITMSILYLICKLCCEQQRNRTIKTIGIKDELSHSSIKNQQGREYEPGKKKTKYDKITMLSVCTVIGHWQTRRILTVMTRIILTIMLVVAN